MSGKNRPRQRNGFCTNELIIYPTHGVGKIVSIELNEFAETKLELFVIEFEKDQMTVRVPTEKSGRVGMRKLSGADVVKDALAVLKGRSRVDHRIVWNRRIPEYEEKIKSGNLNSIAEVARDLYRPRSLIAGQSFNERQVYESALEHMAREIAAILKIDLDCAVTKIEDILFSNFAQAAA